MLDDIADLKERWFELYPRFAELRESMLVSAVKWEWANGQRYDPRPYYFERENVVRGRFLRRIPAPGAKYGVWKCGYNAQGQAIVEDEDNAWETLYRYAGDKIECLRYQASFDVLRGITYLYLQDGQPSRFSGFFLAGSPDDLRSDAVTIWQKGLDGTLNLQVDHETYSYTADRLTVIKTKHIEQLNEQQEKTRQWQWDAEQSYRLDYATGGELDRMTLNGTRITYQRTPPGQTLKSLSETAKSRLVAVIPEVIKAAGFLEPLYCLQLKYSNRAAEFFPPSLEPGLESRRESMLQNQALRYRLKTDIWWITWDSESDGEVPRLAIEDEAALEACAHLQNATGMSGIPARYKHAIHTLYEVAQALNQLNWSKYAPVSPDFIVFVGSHGSTITTLRQSGATQAQIEDWKKRGLL